MSEYDFESTDFALSDSGIHLLRSRYNYKTLEYNSIGKATIKKAREINNAILSLLIGLCLVGFAFMQIHYIVDLFRDPKVLQIHIEAIILPFLPAVVGAYLIYVSLRKGPVLIIEYGKEKYKLRLRDFEKNKLKQEVITYLIKKLSHKLSVEEHP